MRVVGLRQRWSGASLATIAVVIGTVAQTAHAQAFQGTPTTTLGSVSYNRSTPGVETITVNSGQATINWAPSDTGMGGGPINYLPATNTASYVAGTGAPGGRYTVLNRIIPVDPTRSINFAGAVTSAAGGALWFYAPGGILLSSTARFNVGSLLLTAGDPRTDANGMFLTGGNFGVATADGSTSRVAIASGAQINAVAANSYVVAVAPSVQMQGTINVNGSAALVAAEAVDFTYNAGLFDISVTRGTDAATPFTHSGTTTGPAAGAGEFHRIYFVAVPKNTALTMFITAGSQLGFDIAGAANTDGNAIVLSSGYNVSGVVNGDPFVDTPLTATRASLSLDIGSYTSAVTARSNGDSLVSTMNGNVSFASNLTIRGSASAQVAGRNSRTLSIAGTAVVSADAVSVVADGRDQSGGTAFLYADTGGTVTIGGDALVTSRATGNSNFSGAGRTGSGRGGTANIATVSGGSLTIGGNATVDALGAAGTGQSAGVDGGDGIAGQARVYANGTGTLRVVGGVTASALGTGGVNFTGGDLIAGNGTGGDAEAFADFAGTLTIGGAVSVNATGTGGNTIAANQGGIGRGGFAAFAVGTGATTAGGDVTVTANGQGGTGSLFGGAGMGTTAQINTNGTGVITTAGNITVIGSGFGGAATDVTGTGAGGVGTGGTVAVAAVLGGTIRTTGPAGNVVNAQANATGGGGAIGGSATGGTVTVSADNGRIITLSSVTVVASGTGGAGANGNGGAGMGGSGFFRTTGSGTPTISAGAVGLSASGTGGAATGAFGIGGTATGGQTVAAARLGSIVVNGGLSVAAAAVGGDGPGGGSATGGGPQIIAKTGTLTVTGATILDSRATGGNALALLSGAGGAATGGTADVNALSGTAPGTIALQQGTQLFAGAVGGAGGSGGSGGQAGGRGGDATGGGTSFYAESSNGQLTATAVGVDLTTRAGIGGAGGSGETGGVGGAGGNAVGGFAINFGTISGAVGAGIAGYNRTTSVALLVDAIGGNGGAGGPGIVGGAGGVGGTATAGSAGMLARGSEVTTGAVVVNANATGGNGGTGAIGAVDGSGGDALTVGGIAGLLATPQFNNGNPVTVTLASLTANANATGGSSGTGAGGSATAGEAYLRLEQRADPAPPVPFTGSLTITGAVVLSANATGGTSSSAAAGAATGGTAHVISTAGTSSLGGAVALSAAGTGGNSAIGTSGRGTGGLAELATNGGTLSVANIVNLTAFGLGGTAGSFGAGGSGFGGQTNVSFGTNGGTTVLRNGLITQTFGRGGSAGIGGDGRGGTSFIASGANALLDLTGALTVAVGGIGGDGAAGAGGAATGGTATAGSNGGGANFRGAVTLDATARGGVASSGVGGAAQAGQVSVRASGGATMLGSTALLNVFATGGASTAGSGGAGTGGSATIGTIADPTGVFTIAGTSSLDSRGIGGAGAGVVSVGGTGTGGTSQALSVGTATFGDSIGLAALGSGGTGATGGDGIGGLAQVIPLATAAAGSLTIGGTGVSIVQASGSGGRALAGFGGNGGSGTGGTSYLLASGAAFNATLTAGGATQNVNGAGGSGGSGAQGQPGGRGGDGVAGVASAGSDSNAGLVNIGALTQLANGSGGVGGAAGTGAAGGSGGNGFGGTAGAGAGGSNGTPSVLTGTFGYASLQDSAIGLGGAGGFGGTGGVGGTGGSGTGGNVVVGPSGGTMTVAGALNLVADGRGGAGGLGAIIGNGGAGNGGNAGAGVGANPNAGGVSDLIGGALLAQANGVGGVGTIVGATTAGQSLLFAGFGNVRLASLTLISTGSGLPTVPSPFGFIAAGIGGINGTVTIAGDAVLGGTVSTGTQFGGNAAFGIDNGIVSVGGDLTLTTARNIVNSVTATPPGAVETGTVGGSATIIAGGSIDLPAYFTVGQTTSVMAGTSLTLGNYRSGFDIAIAGNGAIVTGSLSAGDSIRLDAQQGRRFGDPLSRFTVTTGDLDAGVVNPAVMGNLGDQIGITGDAGIATGNVRAVGNIGLFALGGSVTTGTLTNTRTVAILAANAVTTGAVATGTTATDYVYVSNPGVVTRDLGLDATGPAASFDFTPIVTVAPLPTAGAILLGGAVATGRLAVATAATLSIAGAVNATASILASGRGTRAADLTSGGTLDVESAGDLTVGNVRGEDDVILNAGGIVRTGNVSAADAVVIVSSALGEGGAVTTGALDAGIVRPSRDPGATFGIFVDATGPATTGALTARGAVGIVGRGGAVTTGAVAAGGSAALLAGGDVTTGAITTASTGTTLIARDTLASLITVRQGVVDYTALLAAAPVRLPGSIAIGGGVDTGVFKASATGNFGAVALHAATALTVDARGLATFAGLADAPTIMVTSGDIAIGEGGALGTAATTQVSLIVDPAATAIAIGGSGGTGWSLDAGEASRVRAHRIAVTASGTQPPVVRLDRLSLSGSAGPMPNLVGAGASFVVATPGSIQVAGPVTIVGAGATDTLQLIAGRRIDVVTDTGGALRVSDAAGNVAGVLDLTAADLLVADAALVATLTANPGFAGRNAALAQIPATATPEGFLGAGGISVTASSSVLIRNSGTLTQRAGFTAGPGGLRLVAPTQGPAVDVVVNGRLVDRTGAATVNERVLDQVALQPAPARFTATSTVNGCVIGVSCVGTLPGTNDGSPVERLLAVDGPVVEAATRAQTDVAELSDDDHRKLEAAEQAVAADESPQVRIERLVSTRAVAADPVVDEAITSGGNSSLWRGEIAPLPITPPPGANP